MKLVNFVKKLIPNKKIKLNCMEFIIWIFQGKENKILVPHKTYINKQVEGTRGDQIIGMIKIK